MRPICCRGTNCLPTVLIENCGIVLRDFMIPKECKRIADVGLSIAEVSMNAAKKSI